MGTTFIDILFEKAIVDLHDAEVMKAARLAQCVYLFVEGESEEKAFPILLEKAGLDLENLGVVIANYNGCNNLRFVLQLLSKTLSHNRPIILTIDNDEKGVDEISRCDGFKSDLVSIFPIPDVEKVKYPDGHVGGSFEEIFDVNHFLDCCFAEEIIIDNNLSRRLEFERSFDKEKPWYLQVKKFLYVNYRDFNFESRKVELAELLANTCNSVPECITKLAELIKQIRGKYPLKHPLDVKLPEIPGLTVSRKKEGQMD